MASSSIAFVANTLITGRGDHDLESSGLPARQISRWPLAAD